MDDLNGRKGTFHVDSMKDFVDLNDVTRTINPSSGLSRTMNEQHDSKALSDVNDVTSHVRWTPEENFKEIDIFEIQQYEDLNLNVQFSNNDEVIVEMNGIVYPLDTRVEFENTPEKTYVNDTTRLDDTSSRRKKKKCTLHQEQPTCRLWEFLRDLLCDPRYNPDIITWSDKQKGEFRLVKSKEIAKLWGRIKKNKGMTYEKLSRALRYYYKTQILLPVIGKRLMYQFGPSSYGWK
ncbi:ETS-related transcription factor Elf-1-like [Ostrea edulis]|uniref:ETS-related transcription factor Elf-1-like n=1 Tax=Ostrea edulis TaxID=37623 RepID=UPI0024AF40DA|nr:ETS-related transcription factor Elf-1-like [Ostrea edulis]